MRRLLFALLAFNFFIGQSNTKNNFLKNVAVSYNIWPACKMGSKSRKAALVIKRLLWRLSFITFWRQWKLQRWIANHKLLVFWLIHYWIRSFCQTWIFSHFLINVPIQCCPQKAVFTHIIPTSSFSIKFWDLLSF